MWYGARYFSYRKCNINEQKYLHAIMILYETIALVSNINSSNGRATSFINYAHMEQSFTSKTLGNLLWILSSKKQNLESFMNSPGDRYIWKYSPFSMAWKYFWYSYYAIGKYLIINRCIYCSAIYIFVMFWNLLKL